MSEDLVYTLGLDGSQFDSTAKAAEKSGLSLGKVLAGLGVTAFAGGFLRRGLEFNQTMRDSEAAIAKVIGQFQNLNDAASKKAAAGAMRELVELEPKASGSLNDLVGGFMSTLAASQSAGISVKENIDLVGRFANAMANASIPTEQLAQEMRSIVTGNIGADSTLARMLEIDGPTIERVKKAGNLYQFLVDKLGKMAEAGDTATVTFSSLQSAVDTAAGGLASGLFDVALEGSKSLTETLANNKEAFEDFGRAIGFAARGALKFTSFVSEAARQASRLAAIAGLMTQEGLSYAEAADWIDEVAEARQRETAAAKAEADAILKVKKAASDEGDIKAKARKEAAAATKSAGLGAKDEEAGQGGKSKKEGAKDESRLFDEILDKQARLDELKRGASREELDTAGRAAAVRQDILRVEQEIANLRSDPFGQDHGKVLDAEARKVGLEREYNALQKEAARDAETAAKKANGQAKAQRERAAEMADNRTSLLGEISILEAQAKGQDKKAEAIRRQLQLERDKKDIMRQTGASEGEASRLAQRKADLEDKRDRRSSSGGDGASRSKIGGVSRRRMMGGGVDDFKALQTRDSDFERLQKSPFGSNNLAYRRSTIGGAAARVSKLMGQTDPRALSERASGTLTPPAPARDKNTQQTGQDPQLTKLDAILDQLVRINTA